MEIQPEIVAANIVEQLTHGQWLSTLGIIFTVNKLFPEGGLNPLIAELKPRQFDADQGEENCPEDRPENRHIKQRIGDDTDKRQLGHII